MGLIHLIQHPQFIHLCQLEKTILINSIIVRLLLDEQKPKHVRYFAKYGGPIVNGLALKQWCCT